MHLLVCAATALEIKPTLETINRDQELRSKTSFVITGIGLAAATYHITKMLHTNRPSLVLQAGICGSLSNDLQLGEVLVIRSECIGDLGVTQERSFHSIFDLKLQDPDEYPWKKGKLYNNNSLLASCGLNVVDATTVNEITTTGARVEYYKEKLQTDVESMEGAALHYSCLLEKIPFLQVRAVSNYATERDKSKWQMSKAVANLNIKVLELISKILQP